MPNYTKPTRCENCALKKTCCYAREGEDNYCSEFCTKLPEDKNWLECGARMGESCDTNQYEPDDSQLEMGFDPYEGCYTYDC